MDSIIHRTVKINGINMHVAEKGEGPVVILLHGFPELWYSWRHQILGLADRGFRAVAPDLRGYGDSDAPEKVDDYTIFHIVGDVVALIDHLGQDKVFVVGHDWGALIAWNLCMFRPDKVKALVNLSVAFRPRNPTQKPVEYLRKTYGDDYYVCKFQEPGVAEKEIARTDCKSIHRGFLTVTNSGPFLIKEGQEIVSSKNQSPLPSWLSEDDIDYFASKFEKTGYTNPINYYRNIDKNWELTAPWTGIQIKVPTKFIVGDMDLTYHYPGIQDYVNKGGMKKFVPFLDEVVVMPGVGHWINQEKAHEITEHIFDYFKRF